MPVAEGQRTIALMADISGALARGGGVDVLLQSCAEALVRQLGAAFARLWLCTPDADLLQLRASAGLYTRLNGTHSRIRLGELKIGRIAAERRPYLTNAVLDDPLVDTAWARREGMVAFAGYPLLVESRVVGVMALFARQPLSVEVLAALAAVSDAVAQYVERERAEAELRQAYALLEQRVEERTRALHTLLDVSRTVSSTLELQPLLGLILEQLRSVVEYSAAAVLTFDAGDEVVLDYRGPLPREQVVGYRGPSAWAPIFREAVRRKQPVIVHDLGEGETPLMQSMAASGAVAPSAAMGHARGLLCVPLVVKGEVTGVLNVVHPTPGFYTERHGDFALGVAQQAAVAIENARLYGEAREKAVLEERQRLARELHDSVTQALYSVTLYAEAANRQLAAGDAETTLEHLREVRATAREALGEMRLLLFELRPPLLEEVGLGAALRSRLLAVEGRSGLSTEMCLDETLRLPKPTEQELYRIVLEALNNVLKHAHASRVIVRLESVGDRVQLEVADNGAGFGSQQSGGGFGLTGMRERAARLGGSLQVESAPDTGTRVLVEVPR